MTKKMLAYARMCQTWVTPLDALRHCGLLSLAQRVSELQADAALMRGRKLLRKWHKTSTGARVRAYRIVKT